MSHSLRVKANGLRGLIICVYLYIGRLVYI